MGRWAWIEVDEAAIEHNVGWVRRRVAPAPVWAVVKADGYGHGAEVAARAALAAGAEGLCVALVQEGVALRRAGITAPILVLSEQPPDELPAAIAAGLQLTVYRPAFVAEIEAAGGRDVPVHLKIDTGMRRVGVHPTQALAMIEAVQSSAATVLAGVFTHLAVADEPDDPFSAQQLAQFDATLASVRAAGHDLPVVHAANSAGGMAHPAAWHGLVRLGIAMYGIAPGEGVAGLATDLVPALSLHARVSFVKRVRAGERISYGLRHTFTADTTVATLPLGYADGVPRRLFAVGGEVLLGGRRRPIVGVVTMDQLMIDCGDDEVAIGDHAVLIGRQGDAVITATDWATALGTIAYEIVCGFSARLERRLVRGAADL